MLTKDIEYKMQNGVSWRLWLQVGGVLEQNKGEVNFDYKICWGRQGGLKLLSYQKFLGAFIKFGLVDSELIVSKLLTNNFDLHKDLISLSSLGCISIYRPLSYPLRSQEGGNIWEIYKLWKLNIQNYLKVCFVNMMGWSFSMLVI